jgi:maltose/moltooligosaccharide transporter
MKLNAKRTVLIGFAFLSICSFWQLYNSVIPLILTNTFKMDETFSGLIMAADNVLALFLLPLFGMLSDRCKSPYGRRMPFILFGTLAAVVLMLFLPLLDNSYFAAPALWKEVAFIVVLLCLLVAMGTYRSPAVALMPDLTPKPLRSKANAVINLMGAVGGVLYLLIAALLYSSRRTAGLEHVNYLTLFAVVAAIMVLSVLVVFRTIRERELEQEMQEYEAAHPEENLAETDASGKEVLPVEVKRSLGFLLASIAFWFIGYNAIETWFTTYANHVWGMSLGSASMCMTIATVGAIISYIPVGAVASKVGRKKTILFGILLLTASFLASFVLTLTSDAFTSVLYAVFGCMGIAWASINVNSLPMVVEMCKGSDVGKFTGYYYTFSMAAQTVSPIAAGWLLKHVGYDSLFVYSAVFTGLSFVTMQFVKHGDSRIIAQTGLEAFNVD